MRTLHFSPGEVITLDRDTEKKSRKKLHTHHHFTDEVVGTLNGTRGLYPRFKVRPDFKKMLYKE